MLGAPVSGHGCDWNGFGKVVAGRIVNGYCRSAPKFYRFFALTFILLRPSFNHKKKFPDSVFPEVPGLG